MRRVVLTILLLVSCADARAQTANDKRAEVDRLIEQMKTAPNERTARGVKAQLEDIWLHAGTPAVDLLMTDGAEALENEHFDDAIQSFSDSIVLEPDLSEAWHQRGRAKFLAGDQAGALKDLQHALQLEPRDFSALDLLTDIDVARADWKGAYQAWRSFMELDPQLPGGRERLEQLKQKASGNNK
jgi:cytochrome c-type biogenesis protein CcmH/NrfG